MWTGIGIAALALLLVPSARSSGQAGGAYIALGDSIAAGNGATYMKSYVWLHYGYLQTNGSGVTSALNTGTPGAGTGDLIAAQLPRALGLINSSTPVKAVTIDIGINEIPFDKQCADTSSAACPFGANRRTILERLNGALAAHDPGVKVQVMEYFNAAVGTARGDEMRTLLLGSDSKIDCNGRDTALGLNDLIHCIAIEEGALPVDVMPVFDAAGTAFIAGDGIHPDDAGHLAIAKAFGGAADPTLLAPSRATLPACVVPNVVRKSLVAAAKAIVRAHCRVGKGDEGVLEEGEDGLRHLGVAAAREEAQERRQGEPRRESRPTMMERCRSVRLDRGRRARMAARRPLGGN